MTANSGSFPRQYPELYDRAWLEREYETLARSVTNIAAGLGCTKSCVSVAIRRVGLTPRPQSPWRIDAEGRECSRCGGYKAWGEFHAAKNRTGHTPHCKLCEHGDYSFEDAKRRLLAKFGITPEEYDWLLEQQGSKCALCLSAESRSDPRWPETVWSLAVDHDHSHCGKNKACKECIRGLLCASCNTMLGRVELAGEPLVLRFTDYLVQRPLLVLIQAHDGSLPGTGGGPPMRLKKAS